MDLNKVNTDYDFENFKKLSEINTDKMIKSGTFAIEPGPRCPVALVNNILCEIEDAHMLVVGTAECTYYNKNNSINMKISSSNNTTWSYCLDSKEVIFGCKNGVTKALEEIDKTGAKVLFLVSTCVPETIGEDFEGIVREANKHLNTKVIYIDGAHFRCYGAIPAKEAVLYSLHEFMEKKAIKEKTINLIGEDANFIRKSELITLLEKHDVKINCVIPYGLTLEDIRKAPAAALSIITDTAALPLAEKMNESFGTPFVFFPHLFDLEEIKEAYYKIQNYLGIDYTLEIEALYAKAKERIEISMEKLRGKSFASGYLQINPFICSSFLSSLGMKAKYIETEYYFPKDKYWADRILEHGSDPYIGRIFNHTASKEVLEAIHIDYLLLGTIRLNITADIAIATCNEASFKLGFEQPLLLIEELALASKNSAKGDKKHGTL